MKTSKSVLAAALMLPTVSYAEVDEIVVTASPIKGDKVAIPVTVLSQDALDRKGGGSLGEVLGDQPGITQSSFAPGASRPIIRGMDNFRIRVQENGIAAHGVSALSEDHGVPIDPLTAKRVEVVRGPATLRYGTKAIGGVVTILNDRIPTSLLSAPETELFASFSSHDLGKVVSGHHDRASGNLAMHVDGFYRNHGNYQTPRGKLIDSFNNAYGGSVGVSKIGDNGHLGANITHTDAKYGIPAGEEALEIDMQQSRLNVAFASGGLTIDGGLSTYRHDEVERDNGDVGSTFKNDEFEARAEKLHQGFLGVAGAVGGQASHRVLRASGEGEELLKPARSSSVALFAFEEVQTSAQAHVHAAARVEHVRQTGFGVRPPRLDGDQLPVSQQDLDVHGRHETQDFTLLSGGVGLVREGDNGQVSLGLNYVERAPELMELFAKGAHHATETFEIGNPDLKKERALSAEAGAELGSDKAELKVTAFYTRFDGFIYKRDTGFKCEEDMGFGACGAPTPASEQDQVEFSPADATFYGLEAEGALALGELHGGSLGLIGRFDLVRATLKNGGDVPRQPPMRLAGGLNWVGENMDAQLVYTRVFAQNRLATGEARTKGFNDLAANIVVNLGGGSALGLAGTNLLDEEERNHVSFKKADVLLPGRSVRLFVRRAF